jgi:AraC-like DNA-binding protein
MKALEALQPVKRVTVGRRIAEINCGDGIIASLAYYTAAGRQRLHSHEFSQVSFLLAGAMQECLEGAEHELHSAAVGYKPAGSRHEDHWGREGALIFSLRLPSDAPAGAACEGWVLHAEPKAVSALVKTCLHAPTIATRGEAVGDLLALSYGRDEPMGARTPPWVEAVRCRINDAPDDVAVETLAEEAGVDRSHLSRAFRRCFGVPPSIYRRRILVARAVQAVAQHQQRFSEVAAQAGFSDQAHMIRTLHDQVGVSPGHLRRMLSG